VKTEVAVEQGPVTVIGPVAIVRFTVIVCSGGHVALVADMVTGGTEMETVFTEQL